MKVRIKPTGYDYFRFYVEKKTWSRWSFLYRATNIQSCLDYIEDLKQISNIELVKYE